MTVSNVTRRTSVVGTNAIGQEISFSFPINTSADLVVMTRVISTGVEATLAETTNYTVNISGDGGGIVTMADTVTITGNVVEATAFYHGILLYGANYCVVTGNVVRDCAQDGINLQANSTYNLISNNQCYSNTDDGIDIEGAGDAYNTLAYNILVDNGTTIENAGVGTTRPGSYVFNDTHTANYTVTLSDFGKTLRMNNGAARIFTFPSVAAAQDGARITFVCQGAGRLTLQMVDSDKVLDSAATGTVYTDDDNIATITLEYVHATVTWVCIGASGTWTTT